MGRFRSGGGGGYAPRSRSAPSRPASRREPPANQTPSPVPAKTSNYDGRGMYTGTQDVSFGIIRAATNKVLSYVMGPRCNSNDHEASSTSAVSMENQIFLILMEGIYINGYGLSAVMEARYQQK